MGWLIDAIRRWRFKRRRMLYTFFDGERTRRIDPWQTFRGFTGDDEFSFVDDIDAAIEGRQPEYGRYIEAICRHLGVQRFDPATGRGMTDEELLELSDNFMGYVMSLKKKSDPSLTWEPATAPTSPESDGVGASTSSPSASGSASVPAETSPTSMSSCSTREPGPASPSMAPAPATYAST